jgi:hypothetical protein
MSDARLRRGGSIRLHHNTPSTLEASLEDAPKVSRDLIQYLDRRFPDSLPPEGSPYSEVERRWGQRQVVEHLLKLFQSQQEEDPIPNVL